MALWNLTGKFCFLYVAQSPWRDTQKSRQSVNSICATFQKEKFFKQKSNYEINSSTPFSPFQNKIDSVSQLTQNSTYLIQISPQWLGKLGVKTKISKMLGFLSCCSCAAQKVLDEWRQYPPEGTRERWRSTQPLPVR